MSVEVSIVQQLHIEVAISLHFNFKHWNSLKLKKFTEKQEKSDSIYHFSKVSRLAI